MSFRPYSTSNAMSSTGMVPRLLDPGVSVPLIGSKSPMIQGPKLSGSRPTCRGDEPPTIREGYPSTHPGPRTTRPGVAPVCSP